VDPQVRAQKTTGSDGRYELEVVGGGLVGVLVTADGFAATSRNQRPGVDLPIALREAAILAVRVVFGETGAPAAGVDLRARVAGLVDGAVVRERSGSTELDGSFEFSDLPRWKELDMEVRAPGISLRVEAVVMSGGPRTERVIRLPEVMGVGRVVDELSRAPIKSALILDEGGRSLTATDALGRFEVAALGANLAVEAPGYCASMTRFSPDPDPVTPVELGLWPAARLRGRVVTPAGAPVPNARVAWAAGHWVRLGRGGDFARPGAGSLEARTDSEGRFEWDRIVWGTETLAVTVEHAGEEREFRGASPTAPGELVELECLWRTGLFVAGDVRYLGKPTVATVLLASETLDPRSVRTDAIGNYALDGLEARRYELWARLRDGSESLRVAFDAESLERRHSITLHIEADRARVEGVLHHEGRPVGGHPVWAAPLGVTRFADPVVDLGGAASGPRGRFEFTFDLPSRGEAILTTRWGASSVELHAWPLAESSTWSGIEIELPVLKPCPLTLQRAGGSVRAARVRWRLPSGSLGGQCAMGAELLVPETGLLEVDLPAGSLDLEVDAYAGREMFTWRGRVDATGRAPIAISL